MNPAFRLATYNIHAGVGTDGKRDVERIARVIRELDVECVALQEVDTRLSRHTPSWQLERLAELLQWHVLYGPTMRDHRGFYGNAFLSRQPIREVGRHELSVSGREPRGVLELDWMHPRTGETWRLLATHLGLNPRERAHQVGELLRLLKPLPPHPLVLLGDFNEWWPWTRRLRPLHRRLGPRPLCRTFPARLPLLALDAVWVRPASRLLQLSPHRSRRARRASDHLPLIASLR